MTVDLAANLLIKPLAFSVAALPLVIDNLRTGQISNWNNAILLVGGLGILTMGPTLGMSAFHLPAPSLWMLVALIPLALFAVGWVGGGAAKFLIALLAWFSPGEYLFVTISGLILAGVIALVRGRKDTQIALPMVVIGLMVQAASIAAGPR